jgi:capsular polysaccharide biosynthesis protein
MLFKIFAPPEKIIVFGTGSAAINFVKRNKKTHRVVGYMDNNSAKHGGKLNGVSIFSPDDINKFPSINVVIASDFYDEIYVQLKENKQFLQTNIIFYRSLETSMPFIEKTSLLLKNKASDLICKIPTIFIPTIRRVLKLASLNLVKILSLDSEHIQEVLILRPEQRNISVGPNFIDRAQKTIDVTIPPVSLYQFVNCQISILSRAFKIDDNNIIVEKIHTISDKVSKYSKGHVIHHYQDKLALVRDELKISLDKGILINGYYDKNYYHWVIDIIPQLQYISELPDEYKDFPILISDMAKRIKSVQELVSLFNINREIIYLPSTNDYMVKNLLIISSPNRNCPRLIGSARSVADSTYCRPETINYIRDLVLKQCEKSNTLPSKKIFLSPSMKHRKYNQEDVFELLKKFGFVKINPEKMTLLEQAIVFNRAEIIVGPTGATWTNLIFAQRDANALCWMAEEWGDFSAFSNLADIVGVKLDYLTYVTGVEDHIDLFSKDYSINQQEVEDWVKSLIDN